MKTEREINGAGGTCDSWSHPLRSAPRFPCKTITSLRTHAVSTEHVSLYVMRMGIKNSTYINLQIILNTARDFSFTEVIY